MTRYKMLGRDFESNPVQLRTWVVNDDPDYVGQFYFGYKSGHHPLENVVAFEVQDDNLVVDFNIPQPLGWQVVHKTLPERVYNSQLAIIDGYTYLFGGQASDRILMASLDRPADWIDSGARLPTDISKSQLAVVDGYIYLFGGQNNAGLLDNIYSAPVSDPLTWTDHGSLLPAPIHSSHIAIIGSNLYLFGGKITDSDVPLNTFITKASDTIYTASLSNPLVWTDTGDTLPHGIFSSQLGISDGYMYLFGGLFFEDGPTSNIYKADINFPTVWTLAGNLPYAVDRGQFFTVGNTGYLIAPGLTPSETNSYSRILTCLLSNPLNWTDSLKKLPGSITSGQIAIIYDRVFFFGANATSLIFASDYIAKYQFDNPEFIAYETTTRIDVSNTVLDSDLFVLLGFPYWKTDYRRIV